MTLAVEQAQSQWRRQDFLTISVFCHRKKKKEEAASLIGKNKEHFGLENIEIIKADAPDGLETLLKPTHAFIGGSSRRMNEILSVLYQKNLRCGS